MRRSMFENLTGRVSLNALRAFEAMGRTGQATAAGAELCVTHSAISRQVKALEARLGVRLFEGPKHQLRVTTAGRELLPAPSLAKRPELRPAELRRQPDETGRQQAAPRAARTS